MATWILVGIGLFLLILFLYILLKGSADDNQATSLNLKADEPISKEDDNAT